MADNISSLTLLNGVTYEIKDALARLSCNMLSAMINKKVTVDDRISGIAGQTDLSVVKLSASDYHQMVVDGTTLSNCLYIVEDEEQNMYGQQIKNLAPGTDLSDAVNLEQLGQVSADIPTKTSQLENDSGFISAHQSLSNYYNKTETSSSAQLATAFSGKLDPSEVKISYVSDARKIVLSSRSTTTSVDCNDFIKDGMLSSAELCGTTLVLKFNTDAGSDPISVELSNFVDDYDQKITDLCTSIDNKIFIENKISGIAGYSDLSVVRLSADEYASMLTAGTLLSNCIYVVDNQFKNMYGQQIKNLAAPTDLSDATTKEYVDAAVSSIQIPTDLSSFTNSPGYLTQHQSLSNYYQKTETSSAAQLDSKFSTKVDYQLDTWYPGDPDTWPAGSKFIYENVIYESLPGYNGSDLPSRSGQCVSCYLATVRYVDAAIPKNVSQLSNDAGYLTQHQSLSDYYTKSQTSSAAQISTAVNQAQQYIDNVSAQLDTKITNKVYVENRISSISGYSDLSVVKLSASDYASLLTSDSLLSNCIYIVEDDHEDAYGQQIKNVAAPTDLSDAANKEYVDNAVGSITIPTDLSAFTNSPGYLTQHQSLSNYYQKTETSSAIQLQATLASIQKTAFAAINEPVATVNSIHNALLSILNILKGN